MIDDLSKEELIKHVENGRECEIALRVLNDFLTERKNELISCLENSRFKSVDEIYTTSLQLATVRDFKQLCNNKIQLGKYAQENLKQDDNGN